MSWLTFKLPARVQERTPARPAEAGQTATIRNIRAAMLAALDDGASRDDRRQRLQLRMHLAQDAPGLWALRGELMTVLAGSRGEAFAVAELLRLTGLFRDVLPQGLASSLDHHSHGERHAGKHANNDFRQQG
jgi:hypothetical protein